MWAFRPALRARFPAIDRNLASPLAAEASSGLCAATVEQSGAVAFRCLPVLRVRGPESLHPSLQGDGRREPRRMAPRQRLVSGSSRELKSIRLNHLPTRWHVLSGDM